jgi:hydrogenase maturation protease
MRTDDAVRMKALEALRGDRRLPHEVNLIAGETLGLDLLYHVEGTTHLMVLDAVDVGEEPGSLLRFQDDEISMIPCGTSVHLLGMSDLLAAMRLLECAPKALIVLGIQPKAIDWGTELTPPVEAGLARIVEAALEQIHDWISPRLVPRSNRRKAS